MLTRPGIKGVVHGKETLGGLYIGSIIKPFILVVSVMEQ